jgi:hypothetical protein
MKIQRRKRLVTDDQVNEEVLRNGGFTDRELSCVPHYVRWCRKPGSRVFVNRFAEASAAANWLATCSKRGYLVIEHNVTEAVT